MNGSGSLHYMEAARATSEAHSSRYIKPYEQDGLWLPVLNAENLH